MPLCSTTTVPIALLCGPLPLIPSCKRSRDFVHVFPGQHTTTVGLNHQHSTVATGDLGPVQTSAAKLRITCAGSNPGAGKIRVTVFYRQFVSPTS